MRGATSEAGIKNAEIEAKGDETQTMGDRKIRHHNPDWAAKIEANCESRILLATDETLMKHG